MRNIAKYQLAYFTCSFAHSGAMEEVEEAGSANYKMKRHQTRLIKMSNSQDLSSALTVDSADVESFTAVSTGHKYYWTTWRCLNRLRTGKTCNKEQRKHQAHVAVSTPCKTLLI